MGAIATTLVIALPHLNLRWNRFTQTRNLKRKRTRPQQRHHNRHNRQERRILPTTIRIAEHPTIAQVNKRCTKQQRH